MLPLLSMRERLFYLLEYTTFLNEIKEKVKENAAKEQGDKRLGEIVLNKVNICMLIVT